MQRFFQLLGFSEDYEGYYTFLLALRVRLTRVGVRIRVGVTVGVRIRVRVRVQVRFRVRITCRVGIRFRVGTKSFCTLRSIQ